MKILKLTDEEIASVSMVINEILRSDDFGLILETHSLIKIRDRRDDVYLIKSSDYLNLRNFMTGDKSKKYKIRTYKIKLGFLIGQNFKIGIESLRFMANYCLDPIIINFRQEERFIYGKNINLGIEESKIMTEKFSDGSLILVSNRSGMPIGYAKILQKQGKIQLKNIVDIGIYLRSEKTAF
ncbi:MAG: hypothetical protein ACW98F_13660 [Candidatus Hodarchaeales archaeon]|jgi:ribosome biogenesis protein Nip4